jgi:hypothetical protein
MQAVIAGEPGSTDLSNADRIVATPSLIVAAGTVSGLWGLGTVAECGHGASWYAGQLAEEIVAQEAAAEGERLRAVVGRAIGRMAMFHADVCDSPLPEEAMASVAVTRYRGRSASQPFDDVEYFILGDAWVAVETERGPQAVTDPRIKNLFLTPRRAVLAAPTGSAEREARVAELVAVQRRMLGGEPGFWVAGADPQAAMKAVMGGFHDGVTGVAVMTAGAARLVDLFGTVGWSDAFDLLRAEGPGGWIGRIRGLEAADADLTCWPRYEASADASIAFADLGQRSGRA